MAEKEKPVADNETGKIKVKAKKEKQPDSNETKGNVTKVKETMKMKPEVVGETMTKVDLDKPVNQEKNEQPEETKEDNVNDSGVVTELENAESAQEQEEVQQETETQETPVLEEVTKEELVENTVEEVQEAIVKAEETGQPLPENVQKLVDFIQETGGDINDYVTLNQDYSNMDNQTLLYEYYKQTKPHLSSDEIDFIMEDQFAYNEEDDTEKEIKRKKLAMKEQVASAKQHLESVKSKYYENIKAGSKLTKEQQKAIDFFNRYNEESEFNKKQVSVFENKTNQVFNDKFKGFEYNVGDKKFRFNVKDTGKIKETQSDINNFIKKFLNKENSMEDAAGYHKGLFTAMNPDQIANHFYEQGKADALKESIAKSKNVSMDPRQSHSDNVNTSGFTARVLNDDGPDFKFKIKNKNK
tara:strand:- start:1042 stop:2280 length:1239 start_codon:yes stop_codon:yes gene_type:complete